MEARARLLMVVAAAHAGGAQTHIVELCRHLAQEFTILVMAGEGSYLPDRLAELGVAFAPNPHLGRSIRLGADAAAFARLWRVVGEFQPDVIHAHAAKAGALARFVPALQRRWGPLGPGRPPARVVYTPHNWSFNPLNQAGSPRFNRWFERLTLPLVEHVICVSAAERRLAAAMGVAPAERLAVIANGIEPPDLSLPGLSSAHPSFESRPGVFRFLWVGRLEEPKWPELAVAAFALLPAATRAACELVVIGAGAKRQSLEAMAQGLPVRLCGERGHQETLRAMAGAGALLLTSRNESFGLVALEAMALGLPVVATAVGGLPEVIRDGVDGVLVASGDVAALAGAMTRLAVDRDWRAELGAAGPARAAMFTGKAMAARTAALYRSSRTAPADGRRHPAPEPAREPVMNSSISKRAHVLP